MSNGDSRRYRFLLRDRQCLVVGSSEWAEICIDDDPEIGDVQFQVGCDGQSCLLTNIDREHRVCVNGVAVSERMLMHGDIITVGGSRFTVMVDRDTDRFDQMGLPLVGRDADSPRASPPASPRRPRKPEKVRLESTDVMLGYEGPAAGAGPARCRYSSTEFSSGMVRFTGSTATQPPDDLARGVDRRFPMHLLLAESELDAMIPESRSAVPLIVRNGASARSKAVLGLITPDSGIDRFDLLGRLWGRGLLVAVFSHESMESLVSRLSACRTLWKSRPHQLADAVQSGSANWLDSLSDVIRAALVESAGCEKWSILVAPRRDPTWKELGLPHPPDSHDGPSD